MLSQPSFLNENGVTALFNATTAFSDNRDFMIDIICKRATLRIEGNKAYIIGVGKTKQLRLKNALNIIGKSDIGKVRKENQDSFWFKNNGLTIICDDFDISGREVHLTNFSIINGGQTTHNISRHSSVDQTHDFYLPCKIIRIV